MDFVTIWFHYPETGQEGNTERVEKLVNTVSADSDTSDPGPYTFKEDDSGFERVELTAREAAQKIVNNGESVEIEYQGLPVKFLWSDEGSIHEYDVVKCFVPAVSFNAVHRDEEEIEGNALAVADLIETASGVLDPGFVWGYLTQKIEAYNPVLDTTRTRIKEGHVDALGWATLFTPQAVDRYGRERLRKAPVRHVHEFTDGAILLIATASPYYGKEVGDAAEDVVEHLAMDIDPAGLPYRT